MRYISGIINAKNVAFAIVAFLAGFIYSYDFDRGTPEDSPTLTIYEDAISGGEYVRMVYIGSPGCGASNNSMNHDRVRAIKDRLQMVFETQGIQFVTTGVSQNASSSAGIQYLKKTGPYDEVIAGLSLYSSGVQRYVWDMEASRAATPQIILVRTRYEVIGTHPRGVSDIQRSDSLIVRKEGADEIWSASKNPIQCVC